MIDFLYMGTEQAAMGTMDGIIDTVSAVHPILPLIGLLKSNGKFIMVGVPDKPLELPVFPLVMGKFIKALKKSDGCILSLSISSLGFDI